MTEAEYKERCNFLNDMMEEARYRKPPVSSDMWKTVMYYAHAERDKAFVEYQESQLQ
jgi:hypothetical protein